MAMAVSRAVIEVLLDRASQGVATLSPEGLVVYANQRLASMLGVTRGSLIGKRLMDLVAEADRAALEEALGVGHDGAAQCRAVLPRANGGGEMAVLLTFAPLGHGQVSCLATDLSQGSNVSVLAHEVRNMLGTVRNSVELIRRTALDADAQRAADAIERQASRLLTLMEDLRRLNPKE
jgi:PAS domain S-box-containing protein